MENQKPKVYTDKFLAITSLFFVFISVAGLAIYSAESIDLAAKLMYSWLLNLVAHQKPYKMVFYKNISVLRSLEFSYSTDWAWWSGHFGCKQ